ncbi:MAG: peptidylprolyl isomerase [SAR324 cluster bacterium]|nr:peptidylprolyl isomerase [SAR324 cluster bacterium]
MKYRFSILLSGLFFSLSLISYAQTMVLDYIKVIVNNEILTNSEIEEAKTALRAQIIEVLPAGEGRDKQLAQVEENVIQNLVDELLILDRAKELKFEITEDDVEQQINRLAKANPQITNNYEPDKLRELVSKDLLKQRVMAQEVVGNVFVTEEEVKKFCEETAESTKELEVAQILFRSSEKEALSKTKLIKKKLQGGVSFGELAKKYSQDPSAQKTGGNLGFFRKGQLLPAIDQVIFSLEEQVPSDLVQTAFGYHLLYIQSVRYNSGADCKKLPEQLYTQYHNGLFDQKRQKALTSYLEKLRESAQIVVN